MRRQRFWIGLIGTGLPASVLFGNFWKKRMVLPVLRMLNEIGGSIPFPVLEYLAVGSGLWILAGGFHGIGRMMRRILGTAATALLMLALLWLPLYEGSQPVYSATAEQMQNCASVLIDELNGSMPDFDKLPEDLPAKFVHFPFWMRRLGISGFYSFFTGEALISPEQPACSLPFVAMHESMHGRGIADEGLCNIAAYAECMERGGVYAGSARLWALRYVLGSLRSMDYAAYADCMDRMNKNTRSLFRQMGGAYEGDGKSGVQRAFAGHFPGSDYEILAHWLAVQMQE